MTVQYRFHFLCVRGLVMRVHLSSDPTQLKLRVGGQPAYRLFCREYAEGSPVPAEARYVLDVADI